MQITQEFIVNEIIHEAVALPDRSVRNLVIGRQLTGVRCHMQAGICSRLPGADQRKPDLYRPDLPLSLHQLLPGLKQQGTLQASLALAAAGSMMNQRLNGMRLKAQDLILELGRGKNVAVIGHFPFVHKLRYKFNNFWVFEKRPRDFDLPETEMPRILPRAELIAVTGTTLLNGTLAEILSMCSPRSIRLLIGPSTPLAFCLGDAGIHYLAGCRVLEPDLVFEGINKDRCFRELQGVEHFICETSAPRE
ncbi:DUF364 domain-containing protein [Desulfonatronospira sp.]|uniref:Rossmann-like domain-containing protein n=1 Tax=Desulfonatronospira sp. TaxID=1962951 RepID=UPI0025BFA475|nr:DUF364 domain-containing protein [Desulfonatronospira sp.]